MYTLTTQDFFYSGDVVVVDCSHQCRVLLMDEVNYTLYSNGKRCDAYGGNTTMFPKEMRVPHGGTWTVVLEFTQQPDNLEHSVRVRRARKTQSA